MTTVFDLKDLPARTFHVVRSVANDLRMEVGEVVTLARRDIMHQLAEKLMKSEPFIETDVDHDFVHLRADCVVLTRGEFRSLIEEQFRKGMQHAAGYMPRFGDGLNRP